MSQKNIADLPHTAWVRIVLFISDNLETLLRLSVLSPDLQRICRPHTSLFFSPIDRYDDRGGHKWLGKFPTHILVHMILNGDVDPTLITDFQCPTQYDYFDAKHDVGHLKGTYKHRFTKTPDGRPGLPRPGFEQPTLQQLRVYDQRIHEAIDSSRWIMSDQRASVFERFQIGDGDAAALILLPLLTKLRAVEPPIRGGLCADLFTRVAREHDAVSNATQVESILHNGMSFSRSEHLPFSELLCLYIDSSLDSHSMHSFWLEEILPFLSIPSLRRIVLWNIRDTPEEFHGWPADAVPCRCPEVYLAQSSLPEATAIKFAEGFVGPCKMTQWFLWDRWHHSMRPTLFEPDWDHLTVQAADSLDGRRVRTSLKCDGGRPGFEHPWVSWLWHGHMSNWRLLDESFKVQDGDKNEDWLGYCA